MIKFEENNLIDIIDFFNWYICKIINWCL